MAARRLSRLGAAFAPLHLLRQLDGWGSGGQPLSPVISQSPGAVILFRNKVLELHLDQKAADVAVMQAVISGELYRRPSAPVGKGCG